MSFESKPSVSPRSTDSTDDSKPSDSPRSTDSTDDSPMTLQTSRRWTLPPLTTRSLEGGTSRKSWTELPAVKSTAPRAPCHVVVLCHGMAGTLSDVSFLAEALSDASETLDLWASTANSGVLSSLVATCDGVERGGARLADELWSIVTFYHAAYFSVRLSLVGVSLGGLYARAALGDARLWGAVASGALRLGNLITFASPHLGVRGHQYALGEGAMLLGVLGATGRELLLADPAQVRRGVDGTDYELAFLPWLAHPASPHVRTLARFERKVLVANAFGDDKVPLASAALGLSAAAIADAGVTLVGAPHVAALHNAEPQYVLDTDPSIAHDLAPPERAMALQLRSAHAGTPWTTLVARFDEWPARLVNHTRIAASKRFMTSVGTDVPRHVCSHLFVI